MMMMKKRRNHDLEDRMPPPLADTKITLVGMIEKTTHVSAILVIHIHIYIMIGALCFLLIFSRKWADKQHGDQSYTQ
jgi:hypothetical protein